MAPHHPLHERRHVHKVFEAHSLRVVLLKHGDDLLARCFDLRGLPEKRDGQVVVNLNRLVRVWTFAIVWHDLRSGVEIELLKSKLHQGYAPPNEGVRVAESLLEVFSRGTVDVERDDVILVLCLLSPFDLGDIAQAAKLVLGERFV